MSSNTIKVDPMEAQPDTHGNVAISVGETGHDFLAQDGDDNVGTAEQGTAEVPCTATACSRHRMKFKDCGMRGNKAIFICPKDHHLYGDDLINSTELLDGTITMVPNAQQHYHDYDVKWVTNAALPVILIWIIII